MAYLYTVVIKAAPSMRRIEGQVTFPVEKVASWNHVALA